MRQSKLIKCFSQLSADTWMFCLAFFLAILSQILIVFGNSSASSFCFYLLFAILFVWFVFNFFFVFYKMGKFNFLPSSNSTLSLFILLFLLLFGFICVAIQTPFSDFSLDYLRKFIFVSSLIISLYLCSNNNFNIIFIRKFSTIVVLAVSYLIFALYLFGISNTYLANGLTLNYQNPNFAGIVLAALFLFLLFGLMYWKSIFVKSIYAIAGLLILYLIFETKCRSALIAIGMVLVCFAYFAYCKHSLFKEKIILMICIISPIAICSFYTFLGTTTDILSILDNFGFLTGKTFSTRLPVWSRAFKLFNTNPFIGSYYNSTVNSIGGISGWQNGELDILVEFGCIFFAAFLLFTIQTYFSLSQHLLYKLKLDNFAIAASLFVFFACIFDSGAFLGLNGLFFISASYLAVINRGTSRCLEVRRVVI